MPRRRCSALLSWIPAPLQHDGGRATAAAAAVAAAAAGLQP
eukprot:COSAG02_NODE_49320_length_327_cov_1.166667_1_plen_40_part_10